MNKLLRLLDYLKKKWGKNVADAFVSKLQRRLQTLSLQPYTGIASVTFPEVRSILITKHNRIFYRVKNNTIEIMNLYDTRQHPGKNPYL